MDYGLRLLSDDAGRITLSGWSQTDDSGPATSAKADHWPAYTLCVDRTQLPNRLTELGLELAPGADINDLEKSWDVYVRHPDITALRARLDRERTRTQPSMM